MNKRNALISTVTGGSFLASFLLFASMAEDQFLKRFPSQYEDDIRFDLFLPIFGSAYLISALVSFLAGQAITRLNGKKFSNKAHVEFVLFAPIFFLFAYLLIAFVVLISLAIGIHFEAINGLLIYLVGFAVFFAGHYRLLTAAKYKNDL